MENQVICSLREPDGMRAKCLGENKESAVLRTSSKSLLRPIALFALLGLAACQAADGTTQAPDTALVKSIMAGVGAVDPKAKPIDYKPRGPAGHARRNECTAGT